MAAQTFVQIDMSFALGKVLFSITVKNKTTFVKIEL